MLMQDELLKRIKELQVLLSDAKIQLPDMEMVLDSVENMNKAEALTKHPYSIWQGKDGNWHTYFPDEHGRRIPRKRKTRDSLEKLIVSYWKEQADNPTVRDVIIPKGYMWVIKKIRILNPFGEYFLMKNGERVRTYAIRRRMQYICKKLKVPPQDTKDIRIYPA